MVRRVHPNGWIYYSRPYSANDRYELNKLFYGGKSMLGAGITGRAREVLKAGGKVTIHRTEGEVPPPPEKPQAG